jgi:hypothetical protein
MLSSQSWAQVADSAKVPPPDTLVARKAPPSRLVESLRDLGDKQAETDSLREARKLARRDTLGKQWPIPGRATRLSLLLPGLGQIYNAGLGRSDVTTTSKIVNVAKVPIIYGVIGLMVGLGISNDNNYNIFRQAYIQRIDARTRKVDIYDNYPRASDNGLLQARDFYRRSRDQAYFWGIVFYAMNGIEAYVAAHLRRFDVSDNLSLQLQPSAIPLPADPSRMSFGGTLTLTLGHRPARGK